MGSSTVGTIVRYSSSKMSSIITIVLCTIIGSQSLSFNGVSSPSSSTSGEVSSPTSHPAGEDLILDCDYSYLESESDQLVVTWYYNNSPIPIYQWVPGLNIGPQVINPMFKYNLDLTYQADSDDLKKHRALYITKPDQTFTGNYKCRVSTFLEEVTANMDVIVYVSPSSLSMSSTPSTIQCSVVGVYPVPQVYLVWSYNSTIHTSDQMKVTPNTLNPALFDVSVAATIEQEDVAPHDMITCEVTIPDTEFNKRIEKNILEVTDEYSESGMQVQLTEDLCKSEDCADTTEKYHGDDLIHPIDYEAVENKVEVGARVETFSEEVATFIGSSGCANSLNIIILFGLLTNILFQNVL